MQRRIGSHEEAGCFERLINELGSRSDVAILQRDGAPVATRILYSLYEALRNAGFDAIRSGAERADMSEEEAMELALRAIAAARAEQRRDT